MEQVGWEEGESAHRAPTSRRWSAHPRNGAPWRTRTPSYEGGPDAQQWMPGVLRSTRSFGSSTAQRAGLGGALVFRPDSAPRSRCGVPTVQTPAPSLHARSERADEGGAGRGRPIRQQRISHQQARFTMMAIAAAATRSRKTWQTG